MGERMQENEKSVNRISIFAIFLPSSPRPSEERDLICFHPTSSRNKIVLATFSHLNFLKLFFVVVCIKRPENLYHSLRPLSRSVSLMLLTLSTFYSDYVCHYTIFSFYLILTAFLVQIPIPNETHCSYYPGRNFRKKVTQP